jgi:hypothetical protein
MGDVPLVPEGNVLEADDRVRPHDAREPADALGDDRVPLVWHRRGAFLSRAERLLHLAHLRAGEMADLSREALERRREQRERGEKLGVAVALEDLRRARGGFEAEPLAGDTLDLGVDRCILADGARKLADPQPGDRPPHAVAFSLERERPAGELEPEGGRLRVHAVRAAHAQRLALLLGPQCDDLGGALDPFEDQRARFLNRERQCRVEHVR